MLKIFPFFLEKDVLAASDFWEFFLLHGLEQRYFSGIHLGLEEI